VAEKAEKRNNWLDQVVLTVFIVFVAGLALLTLDQFFGFGIIRPKLDRRIVNEINELADPTITSERRTALEQEIVSYHEFSVPLLIESIEKGKPAVKAPATKCLQEIARTYFNSDITSMDSNATQLKQWWRTVQEQFKSGKAG
jgi:hypothetical protein